MSITYTYEIIAVDKAARCMEVVYSADGHQTIHIGARLPYEGEILESIIQMYAPVAYWREQKTAVVAPELKSGSITAIDFEPKPVPYDALRRQAYREESDPLFFKAQRGEGDQQVWLNKIAEIKTRYPKK